MEKETKETTTDFGAPESDKFDQTAALNVLVNAVHVGQNRGAWKLEEVPILLKAINSFVKKD